MNKIPNRKAICDTLMEAAKEDKDIVVLCSDSRGSASLTPFADACPDQFVEMGIAEQNLVSVSAGLAKCGKKPFAASPACFLSTRSYEQIKVDAAYSNTNVKLIGISGGVSYGALGMSHHSAQDIAALSAIPNMRVYLPSDRFQTACLVKELLKDDKPAYIRVGRNAVEDIYEEGKVPFSMDKATVLSQGGDVAIIACGEMVKPALDAGRLLGESGISAGVVDMYCVKPLDEEAVQKAAGAGRAGLPVAVPVAQRPGRGLPGQPPLLVAGGAAQRSGVCRGQGQPGPGRVDGGLPPHPLRSHQHPERPAGAAVQTGCPHRLPGGNQPAVPVQVSFLRTLP